MGVIGIGVNEWGGQLFQHLQEFADAEADALQAKLAGVYLAQRNPHQVGSIVHGVCTGAVGNLTALEHVHRRDFQAAIDVAVRQ